MVWRRERGNVCGVMLEVSPVKKSSRDPRVQYFDGKLTDGKKVVI